MIDIFKFNFCKKYKKHRGKRAIWQVLAVWLALTVGVGVMGSAAALWYDTLVIEETVDTGNVNPDFTVCEELGSPTTPAAINVTVENIDINIVGVSPGYSTSFNYVVTNKGTVSVNLKSDTPSTELGISVQNSLPISLTEGLDPGQSITGTLAVTVDGSTVPGMYTFSRQLVFEQWNAHLFTPLDGSWQETLNITGNITVTSP